MYMAINTTENSLFIIFTQSCSFYRTMDGFEMLYFDEKVALLNSRQPNAYEDYYDVQLSNQAYY